jgi:hypothetical protein
MWRWRGDECFELAAFADQGVHIGGEEVSAGKEV